MRGVWFIPFPVNTFERQPWIQHAHDAHLSTRALHWPTWLGFGTSSRCPFGELRKLSQCFVVRRHSPSKVLFQAFSASFRIFEPFQEKNPYPGHTIHLISPKTLQLPGVSAHAHRAFCCELRHFESRVLPVLRVERLQERC